MRGLTYIALNLRRSWYKGIYIYILGVINLESLDHAIFSGDGMWRGGILAPTVNGRFPPPMTWCSMNELPITTSRRDREITSIMREWREDLCDVGSATAPSQREKNYTGTRCSIMLNLKIPFNHCRGRDKRETHLMNMLTTPHLEIFINCIAQ